MPAQSIYLSCDPADWEATRGLRDALGAASIPVVARQPDAIRTASRFVACFSRGPGGAVRYDRQELHAAIERPRLVEGQLWLLALKLQPCHLPVLPIDWRNVPTIEPTTDWDAVVEEILRRESKAKASTLFTAEELAAGGDAIFVNADLARETSIVPDAETEVRINVATIDKDVKFTNVVVRDDRRKKS